MGRSGGFVQAWCSFFQSNEDHGARETLNEDDCMFTMQQGSSPPSQVLLGTISPFARREVAISQNPA